MTALDPAPRPSAEFSSLVSEHQGRLYAYILALVSDPHVADDVLQQTNLVLWRKADQFDPSRSFKGWAFGIAQLEARTHRRNVGRDRLVLDESLVEQLGAQADREDGDYEARRRRLLRCLGRLNDQQRRLVVERYVEGKPVERIAVESSRTANSVSQALFRVRRRLIDCVRTSDG